MSQASGNRCLNVVNDNTSDNARLEIWQCSGGDADCDQLVPCRMVHPDPAQRVTSAETMHFFAAHPLLGD